MSLANVLDKLANAPGAGESGRIRENRFGILPHVTASKNKALDTGRENGENLPQPYTCAGTRAHTRARGAASGKGDSPFSPILPPPAAVTVLKQCRCVDCRYWFEHPYNECEHGIIRNGLLPVPQFPADAWHWCALYHGPQVSRDVWPWPRGTHAEVAEVAGVDEGPSSGPSRRYRDGNGSEPGLFRSTARTQGKEA